MLKKNNLLIILFFSTSVKSACLQYSTRWIEKTKMQFKSEKICFNNNRPNSPTCDPIVSESCPFFKIHKNKPFTEMFKQVGSPGFNLCHSISGIPQIYEIKVAEKWQQHERCFWKDQKSFIDISELIDFYKTL